MTDDEKLRWEARLTMTRRISQSIEREHKRIGDRIEQMLYETKSPEVSEALVSLARHIFEGSRP